MRQDFDQQFIDHCESNKNDFQNVKNVLTKITDNHLAHLTDSVNKIENTQIKIETNQDWLLRFFWLITGVTVSTLVASILTLIFK
jgi:ribosomal protein S17E